MIKSVLLNFLYVTALPHRFGFMWLMEINVSTLVHCSFAHGPEERDLWQYFKNNHLECCWVVDGPGLTQQCTREQHDTVSSNIQLHYLLYSGTAYVATDKKGVCWYQNG